MLGSKNAQQAKRLGLVDLTCDLPSLEALAVAKCTALVDGSEQVPKRKKSWVRWATETKFGADYVVKKAKEQVDKSTRGKYPAPYEILKCAKYALTAPSAMAAFEKESAAFARLAATPESAALLGLFEGSTALKKNRFIEVATGLASKKPRRVCILGAGLMGAGIAQVSAAKGGLEVVLKDRDAAAVARGVAYVEENLAKQVARKRLTAYEKNTRLALVKAYHDEAGSSKAAYAAQLAATDVVIEAVFEDLALKHAVIEATEPLMRPDAVFATNTSAIPIAKIAIAAKRPEQVLGMHYFSPVPMMPLLEIIPHAKTADLAMAKAFQVGIAQGKTCIEVKDVPGFFVNRCLSPMMAEIAPLFAEGVTPKQLDEAVLDLGFPVGPVTLCDEVGADVAYKTASTMIQDPTMGKRMGGADPTFQKKMIDNGWLGRKTNKGFFIYDGKKKTPNEDLNNYIKTELKTTDANLDVQTIQDRYICRFINEAAKCLEDGIINSPVDGDIGAVFGVGFPPFLGGPFKLLDAVGAQIYVDKMSRLQQLHGDRFEPCDLLKDHAKASKKFHG